jgi:hypothetical protein
VYEIAKPYLHSKPIPNTISAPFEQPVTVAKLPVYKMPRFTRRIHKRSPDSKRFISFEPRYLTGQSRSDQRVEDAEIRRPKELTDEQLSRALALANIQLSSQRPDEDLVQRMREKNVASGSQLANGCAPSMGPPSSMLVSSWSHDLAGSLPVPAIDSFKVASTTSQRYDNGDFSTGINTWEDRANKGIAHKTLSLKKVWDHKTWKQKANNLERLKLLKDDGYDIASLQVKGTSADTITVALLAHLKARNERSSDPASAVAAVPLSSTSDEDAVDQESELSAANELSEEMLQAVPELVQSEAE